MKKSWLLLLVCFVLLLSGCRVHPEKDNETAEVITEEKIATRQPEEQAENTDGENARESAENTDGVNAREQENTQPQDIVIETPQKQQTDTQPESNDNSVTFENIIATVTDVGDGYAIVNTYHYDGPIYFKIYTENKYIKKNDYVDFSGDIVPLEKSEQYKNSGTVYYVAKKDAKAKFVFDPADINADGYIEHVTDDSIFVYLLNRGIRIYTDKANEYCVRDYVNISGAATPVKPYTVGNSMEISFEIKSAKITFETPEMVKKPVIYLYPEKETEVSVTLDYDGRLTCTYPEYNGIWQVTAKPDGTLFDKNGREYYCLYWEGEQNTPLVYDKSVGFVVKGEDTAEFLREKLLYLGLNEREANEFIIYWLPQMEDNPYNYIYFSGNEYTGSAKLDIAPHPDTLIRIMMAWEPLESPKIVTEQKLDKAPERKGFTAVEWGGTQIK